MRYYHDLEKQYSKAARAVDKELTVWYSRLAVNNEVSMTEARKMLTGSELEEFRWSAEEYIEKGRTLNISKEWSKQLENASARWHISRLEAMKLQMQQQVEVLYGNELDSFDRFMREIYTDSYYGTAFEIQKGVGIGQNLALLDTRKIDKVMSRPWAPDGSNFSSRIWKQKTQLVNELNNVITQSFIRGQSPDAAIKHIADRFLVSKGKAANLVMTETAFFHSAGQRDMFKELGVQEYEIVATLDSKTSTICQELDGTHRPMTEFEPGVTAPPFHCRCRSTTVPYFDDEFTENEQRAARGKDEKTYYVPSDMTYSEWKDTFVGDYRESSHRTKKSSKSDYGVSWDVVKSKKYNERFDTISDNKKANELALKHARNMLANREGKNTEEIYAISLTTGKDISSILDQNNPFGVIRTDSFNYRINDALSRKDKILYLHNHPRGFPPSIEDLNEIVGESNSVGITVGHNGSLYLYTAPNKEITDSDIRVANRKMQEYNYDLEDYVKFLEVLSEQMNFTFRKL